MKYNRLSLAVDSFVDTDSSADQQSNGHIGEFLLSIQ